MAHSFKTIRGIIAKVINGNSYNLQPACLHTKGLPQDGSLQHYFASMKVSALSFTVVTFGAVIASCNNKRSAVQHSMAATNTSTRELTIIDSLLQDKDFAASIAMELDAAYCKSIVETVAAFLQPGGDSLQIDKSIQEEKITAI